MKGPHLRIVASCHGCECIKITRSTAGHYGFTECSHSKAPSYRILENSHTQDSTPQWCPLLKDALAEFTRDHPQHKVNQ